MSRDTGISSLGPYRFCPLCGAPLSICSDEAWPRRYCAPCNRMFYHNPVPAAGGVLTDAGRVLLVRRKFEPRAGAWTLPAGFLEYHESPAACARREVEEETGLKADVSSLFGVYSGNDDPRFTAVLILYRMQVRGGRLAAGDDASEAAYFARDELPDPIAFRAHRQALHDLYGPPNALELDTDGAS